MSLSTTSRKWSSKGGELPEHVQLAMSEKESAHLPQGFYRITRKVCHVTAGQSMAAMQPDTAPWPFCHAAWRCQQSDPLCVSERWQVTLRSGSAIEQFECRFHTCIPVGGIE